MSGENGNGGNGGNGGENGGTGDGQPAGGNGTGGDNAGAGNGNGEGNGNPTGEGSGTDPNGAGNGTGNGEGGDAGNGNGDAGDGEGGQSTDWRKHAKTWETRAGEHKNAREKAEAERDQANATVQAVLKAAGIETEETDPAKVAEQAQNTVAERDATIRAITVERAAEKAARKAGADVDRLTDSRSFATAAAKLNPDDDGFDAAMTTLVEKQLEEHPHLRAQSTPPPPSSEDMRNGGEGGDSGGKNDDDDLDALSKQYAERH